MFSKSGPSCSGKVARLRGLITAAGNPAPPIAANIDSNPVLELQRKPTRACIIRAQKPQATVRVLTLGAWRPSGKLGINYQRNCCLLRRAEIYKRTFLFPVSL
jgi:hypothetical protein